MTHRENVGARVRRVIERGDDRLQVCTSGRLRWLWSICGALILVDVVGLFGLHLRLAVSAQSGWIGLFLFGSLALTEAGKRYAAEPRGWDRLALLLHFTLLLILFLNACSLFDYMMATFGRPVIDPLLQQADASLGFDWQQFSDWVASHAELQTGLTIAYRSVGWQALLLIILGVVLEREVLLFDLLFSSMVSAVAVCIVFAVWPAFGHPSLVDPNIAANLLRARASLAREITFASGDDLIAFPSYHAVMAILLAYAASRYWLTFVLVPLNLLMLVSTMPIGGHYLTDVIAGTATALLSIAGCKAWTAVRHLLAGA